jgi:hypothetical protein
MKGEMVPSGLDRRRGEYGGLSYKGEMAEWSNAAVLKTVFRLSAERGFESLFLRQRQSKPFRRKCRNGFVFRMTEQNLFCEGHDKNKILFFRPKKQGLLCL